MKDNNKFQLDVWGWITLAILILYGIFLCYPLGRLLVQAFYSKADQTYTLQNFVKFFSHKYYFSTLWNSFLVTFFVTILSLVIGTPLAYFFSLYKIKGKAFLQILIILASMSAPFIGAYSWILLLGRSGIITKFLLNTFGVRIPSIYGFIGILLVETLQLFPLVFLYIQGALKNVDNSLIEASENMGCTGAKRFFKVIIPLVMPTLLAGGLLVFMRALADFGTPMLIGEGFRTFPVLIYSEFISEVGGDDGFASAISIIAILITAIVFLVQRYLSQRTAFTMNALHPIEPKPMKKLQSLLVHGFAYLVIGVAIMPQVYVSYTSFLKTKGLMFVDGYSLDSYKTAFKKMSNSITNTFLIPGIALVIIVFLAVLIAYLVVRRRNMMTSIVDTTSMLPYIIPGSVVGIALLISFSKKPVILTGTMVIMIVALVIRRLPYTIRSSVAILQQIPITIEEAAISLGASKMKTFFKVTMPMMSAGIISGAILSWVTMITELATAIILYSNKTKTLTIAVYTEVIRGNYGIAAALSTILTALTVISLLVFMRISKGKDISI